MWAIHDFEIPVVLNTLRFPMSVISTVGEAWYQIADVPILTVLLNGSVLGYIKCDDGQLHYEELAAFPLAHPEIASMLKGVRQLIEGGIDDLLVFFYSRNWKEGETLWTPKNERVAALQKKIRECVARVLGSVDQLTEELVARFAWRRSSWIGRRTRSWLISTASGTVSSPPRA